MCRLLGVVSSEPTDFRLSLREAPRSLAFLSREHCDGWGVAVFEESRGWSTQKGSLSAHADEQFHSAVAGSHGELLVAHVRKRTVGPVTLANTHPFQRDKWMFAHNGTVQNIDYFRERASAARLAQIVGDTDSEVLFSMIMTRLDVAGAAESAATDLLDEVVRDIARELGARTDLGACTFLLSDGNHMYAHRSGRTLFLLERVPGDEVRKSRQSEETGAILETPWSARRRAVLVASEQLTDEPWIALEEGATVRVTRAQGPRYTELRAS